MDKKNKNSERKTKTRPFTERVRKYIYNVCMHVDMYVVNWIYIYIYIYILTL